ncbi:MAG TPA: sigma-54 dependent transcriptional regulator [Kofleriaceae bacterium]|nr:sigma-54 dependent transcriptional regulator [Kofleriaceae bacterium]
MGRVLLVDDDRAVLYALTELLRDRGHQVTPVGSGREALAVLDQADAVLTDLAMPEMDGMQLLSAALARDTTLPIVLLTAHGSERVAVAAMKAGAYDYLRKPFDIDEVAVVMERALEARRLRLENRRFSTERILGRRIIGESAAMRRLLDAAALVARRDVTVLVRGETGTGKEFLTALLHAESPRASKPLVRFNCAAIPAELAEAELFGHVRGAFTGAHAARRGFFAEADGGTLVLDEIGELPVSVQAKLLRALQEGEIQPVGSGRIERVDVRIVASTNRDLAAEAAAGRFREDLYYRLAVVEIVVPPLRERRDDIPALATEFARRYADKFELDDLRLAPDLVDALARADWPGNVRQLENTIARFAALSPGGEVGLSEFDASAGAPPSRKPAAPDGGDEEPAIAEGGGPSLREQVEAFERNVIARALTAAAGNQSETARRLGVSRVTLIDKLKKYGLSAAGRRS